MATELAKAYVQIVPSAKGIEGSISNVLGEESSKAGENAGESIASSLCGKLKTALVTLGVGKIISDAIGNASEFETAMAKTSTLFTGSEAEFTELQNQILQLSSAYGVAATELAEAAYSAESASVPMEQLGSMLESSAKLAQAGFTDIDTALSATAKTMNAYGEASMSADEIQKVLIQTQNLGITTVGELGASLANVTPTAAAMGVSFDQIGAAMAQMTAQGVPTAQATTQLRSAMSELGKAGTTADKSFRAAAEGTQYAGMSFQEAIASGANLGDVFGLMQTYADNTGLSMVDLWGSVEAGNAAMMIASDVEKFNSNLEAMGTDADVVSEAYEKMADTFGSSMNRLKESATNFMTTLFNGGDISQSFDTMLSNLGDVGEKLLGWMETGLTTLGENLPNLMTSLLDFGAGILESLGKINWIDLGTTIVNGLIGAMGTLGERLIELVGDGISAVVNGDVDFASVGTAIYNGITSVVQTSGEWMTELMNAAKAAGEGIDWAGIGTSILGGVVDVLGTIGETIGGMFEEGVTSASKKDWPSVGEAIKTGVTLALGAGEFLAAAFEGGAELIRSINWTNVGAGIESLIVTGLDGATTLVSTISGAADRLITSIDWEGTASGISDVLTAGLDVAEKWLVVVGDAGAALVSGIHWDDLGGDISDLLSGGLEGAATMLQDGFTAAHDFIMGINWAEVGQAVQSGIGDVWSGLTGFLGGILGGAGEAVSGIGSGIGAAAEGIGTAIAKLFNGDDAKQAAEDLKQAMADLEQAIKDGKTNIETAAKEISTTIKTGLESELSTENMKTIGKTAAQDLVGSMNSEISVQQTYANIKIGQMRDSMRDKLIYADTWENAGKKIMSSVRTGLTASSADLDTEIETIRDSAIDTFSLSGWNEAGGSIVTGIIEGINANASSLYNTMRNLAYNALQAAQKALGIASPSKVMEDQVGKWIPAGIASGIEKNEDAVVSAMAGISADLAGASVSQNVSLGMAAGSGAGSGDVVSAILGLRNDLLNIRLMIGEKTFGHAVVDYGGRYMMDYIGGAESSAAYGYGT